MIISKYLFKELLKKQIIISLILVSIFFCQQLLKVLKFVTNIGVTINLVLTILLLDIPQIITIILPLSLFLAILLVFNKMHANNEIIAMYSCGISKITFLQPVLGLSILISIIVSINIFYINPYAKFYQSKIIKNTRNNICPKRIAVGQFEIDNEGNILFIEKKDKKKFKNIFFAHFQTEKNIKPVIVIANYGKILKQANDTFLVVLIDGTYIGNSKFLEGLQIIDFKRYELYTKHSSVSHVKETKKIEQKSINDLWFSNDLESINELHWRLVTITSVPIMALVAVSFSIKCRINQLMLFTTTILLYLFFFILINSIRFDYSLLTIKPYLMWSVDITYVFLGFILNIIDTVLAYRICNHFSKK